MMARPHIAQTMPHMGPGTASRVPAAAPIVDLDVRDVTYRGEYKDGRPHGRGYKIWADGDWYEGEWRHGRQHGRGSTFPPLPLFLARRSSPNRNHQVFI
jgi:hypothetical protein